MGAVVAALAWTAHCMRVHGTRLARLQAMMDFPGDEVIAARPFVVPPYRYAEVTLRDAGVRVYQIARREEAAFRVDDPRTR